MVEMAMFNVQRNISKRRQIRVTVHEFSMSYPRALNLCEVLSKYLSFQLTEQTLVHGRNGYCSKGCNSKGRLTRVVVLCSACCLIVLYIF